MTRTYRCQSCGASWMSYREDEAGRCLRCDGVMFLYAPSVEDPPDSRAEIDAAPPVPNGLEDDAEK